MKRTGTKIYYESRRRPPFYKCVGATTSYEIMNNSINDYYVIENGYVVHKTLLKCIINPILRIIQFYSDYPYVISSISKCCPVNGWYFLGYKFNRVKYLRD